MYPFEQPVFVKQFISLKSFVYKNIFLKFDFYKKKNEKVSSTSENRKKTSEGNNKKRPPYLFEQILDVFSTESHQNYMFVL